MNRRQYLAGVTGGLAAVTGCLTERGEQAETRGEAEFEERMVSLVSIDEEPSYLDVSVKVVESRITASHTATVRLSFKNIGSGESPGIGIERRNPEPISSTGSDDGEGTPTMFLVPAESKPYGPIDGCWTLKEAGGPFDGSAGGIPDIRLKPGRSYTNKYLFWDADPDAPCMPPGKYQFDTHSSGWRFTLSLENAA